MIGEVQTLHVQLYAVVRCHLNREDQIIEIVDKLRYKREPVCLSIIYQILFKVLGLHRSVRFLRLYLLQVPQKQFLICSIVIESFEDGQCVDDIENLIVVERTERLL